VSTDPRITQGMGIAISAWTGLSAMQLETLQLRFEPCLCGLPGCAGVRAELAKRFHVVNQALVNLDPARQVQS